MTTAAKRQERQEQFKLKDVEMRFNADGEETYDVVVYPKFRNGWSNYTREMFLWGENPKATFEALGKLPKESIVTLNIVSGKVKQNKQDDGQFESYFWNVVGIADGQQASSQPPQGGRQAGSAPPVEANKPKEEPAKEPWDYADTQAHISWGQAVNLAVEGLGVIKHAGGGDTSDRYLHLVEFWANRFYPLIRKGPSPQAEGPVSIGEEPFFLGAQAEAPHEHIEDAPEAPQEATDGGEEPAQPPSLPSGVTDGYLLLREASRRGAENMKVHALFRVPDPHNPGQNIGNLHAWLKLKGNTLERAWEIVVQQLGLKEA